MGFLKSFKWSAFKGSFVPEFALFARAGGGCACQGLGLWGKGSQSQTGGGKNKRITLPDVVQ